MPDPENSQGGKWWTPGPIDTFFLVGTGACIGSWDPVRAAILEVDELAELHVEVGPSDPSYEQACQAANDAANFWFAELVHRRRRCKAFASGSPDLLRAGEARHLDEEEIVRRQAKFAAGEAALAKMDRDVKAALVQHLKDAVRKETIRVRREFWSALRDPRFEDKSMWFATTNWDFSLETVAVEQLGYGLERVQHFHGSTSRPERLFLPSEVLEEPYRSPQELVDTTESAKIWKPLNWAREICIYGLGLSVSDAELAQTLQMGFDDHRNGPGTVVIYNLASALPALERKIRRLSGRHWSIELVPVETLSRR